MRMGSTMVNSKVVEDWFPLISSRRPHRSTQSTLTAAVRREVPLEMVSGPSPAATKTTTGLILGHHLEGAAEIRVMTPGVTSTSRVMTPQTHVTRMTSGETHGHVIRTTHVIHETRVSITIARTETKKDVSDLETEKVGIAPSHETMTGIESETIPRGETRTTGGISDGAHRPHGAAPQVITRTATRHRGRARHTRPIAGGKRARPPSHAPGVGRDQRQPPTNKTRSGGRTVPGQPVWGADKSRALNSPQ